jgi:hypothetical protein
MPYLLGLMERTFVVELIAHVQDWRVERSILVEYFLYGVKHGENGTVKWNVCKRIWLH